MNWPDKTFSPIWLGLWYVLRLHCLLWPEIEATVPVRPQSCRWPLLLFSFSFYHVLLAHFWPFSLCSPQHLRRLLFSCCIQAIFGIPQINLVYYFVCLIVDICGGFLLFWFRVFYLGALQNIIHRIKFIICTGNFSILGKNENKEIFLNVLMTTSLHRKLT